MTITKEEIRPYLTFLAIGCVAFLIDLGVYYVLTRKAGLTYIVARSISLFVTFIWSYTANRFITFKQSQSKTLVSMAKFFVINGAAIALNLIGMKIFVGIYNFPDLLTLLLLTAVISVLSYGGHKSWTFRD